MLDRITWLDAAGSEHVLHDPANDFSNGAAGTILVSEREHFAMPPIEHNADVVPFQAGALLRSTRVGVRELDLNMVAIATGIPQLRAQLRSLIRAFNPLKGPGVLRVACDTGTRELTARYSGGLELAESSEQGGRVWQKFVLTLIAHDPFWRAADQVAQSWAMADPDLAFFPFFPLHLSASAVLGASSIDNPGDVSAWPLWTVRGPADELRLTNTTTGAVLNWTGSLAAGQEMVIDTRLGAKSVTDDSGANRYSGLVAGSSLWALEPGVNDVELTVAGAGTATRLELVFRSGWLSV
jgi:hypothetical protein